MSETAAHLRAERELMAAVANQLEAQTRELFGHQLTKVAHWPIVTTGTHGWVRTIAHVQRGLWLRVWYDHYLGLDATRYFSVWLNSSRTDIVEQRAREIGVPLHPRRSDKHRSEDSVLAAPEGFLGQWLIDDWAEHRQYYVGRYSPMGTAAHGRDRIVKALLADVRTLLGGRADISGASSTKPEHRFAPSDEGTLALVRRRAGQGAFRDAVLQHFRGRCVVTGCDVADVLEAAHIVPWSENPEQDATRALLLRADLHTLFDRGLWNIERRSGRAVVVLTDDLKGTDPYGDFEGPLAGVELLAPSHWAALGERQAKGGS